jgi:hypothetical protein
MNSNTQQSVPEKNPHVVYQGPITPESIDQFPKEALRAALARLAKPRKLTISK